MTNRILIYNIYNICKVSAKTPSEYLGWDYLYNDTICYMVDNHIIQFGQWVDSRKEEMTGGKRPTRRYRTMGEVLGYKEEEIRQMHSEEQNQAAAAYLEAHIQAQTTGAPLPNPIDFGIQEDEDEDTIDLLMKEELPWT